MGMWHKKERVISIDSAFLLQFLHPVLVLTKVSNFHLGTFHGCRHSK
jgi:hypothetical protein